jgi:integration host factor subunit beta
MYNKLFIMSKSISRSDLIETLANKFHIDNKISEKAVKSIINLMSSRLSQEERIEIRGFGSFEIRERTARAARNPKTGESVNLGRQYNVHFKAGEPLREKINRYI